MPFRNIFQTIYHMSHEFLDVYSAIAVIFVSLCLVLGNILSQNYYKNEDDQVIELVISSMRSMGYKYVLIVEMTTAALLLLDVFIYHLSNMQNMFMSKGSLTNTSILGTLLLASSINFFITIPNGDYQLMYRIFQTRLVVVFCAILSYLYRYGGSYWRSPYLIVSIFIGCSGSVFKIVQMTQNNMDSNIYVIFSMIGGSCHLIACLVLIIAIMKWCINLRIENTFRGITMDEWNCTIYATLGFITILSFILVMHIKGSVIKMMSLSAIIWVEIIFCSFSMFLSFYQTHLTRRESVKYKEELEFKRMFVRYISHEVRTPLNTAIMGLQLLDEELRITSMDSIDTVKDIKTSCEVAVNVLNELLTFDKLEAGTLMVEKTQFKAMELIGETVHPFQVQARKGCIVLAVKNEKQTNSNDINIKFTIVHADRNKISQIIRNMVSNGLKFTPPGGTVDVLVDVVDGTAEDGRACKMLKVDVVDSGAGISPENQKRLFKEIVQFNPGKLQKGGGSGLGLYISYGIAKLHGGRLSVHSKGEGHGCTFTLLLPCSNDELPEEREKALMDMTGIYSVHNSSMRQSSVAPGTGTTSSINLGSIMKRSRMEILNKSRLILQPILHDHDRDRDRDRGGGNGRRSSGSGGIDSTHSISHDAHILGMSTHPYPIHMINMNMNHRIHPNPYPISCPTSAREYCHSEVSSTSIQHTCINNTNIDMNMHENHNLELHMLVVDDSVMSRKMQCRLLRKRCVSCIEAENGQEAVDKVKMAMTGGEDGINPIDLIIMDCNMPVMNGMDATRMMRDMGYKGYIIGVTGNVTTEDIEDFINHGADVVLAKPLDIEKFDKIVANYFLHNEHRCEIEKVVASVLYRLDSADANEDND